ncbi:MAG TPA: MFS transporter [Pseudogracilibacillus sp.]|nr:MFS transporter [Pseudogracilibacillus sp.]
MNQIHYHKRPIILMVLILGSLTAFGPLSMDMYLPALPIVTTDFDTTASLAQLSITTCLLGLALGQLIFGPLSDIVGRKSRFFSRFFYIVSLLFYVQSVQI